jgi:hypothetical protein
MKRMVLAVVAAVALALLGGAAYVGSRLSGSSLLTGGNREVMVSESDGLARMRGTMVETEYAPEMPQEPPEVAGLFVRREDNSLFVGTGQLSAVKVGGDRGGPAEWDFRHDGPVVEVVGTHDTQVYLDETLRQLGGLPPAGPVRQVLRPGSLDELEPNCTVSAWGDRRGDRVVARVIVVYLPQ